MIVLCSLLASLLLGFVGGLFWFLRATPARPTPFGLDLPSRLLLAVSLFIPTLALLAALGYAVENWRGERAWEQARRALQARGEVLEWSAFSPPPIPDGQNLAMAPFFVRELGYSRDPVDGKLVMPFSPSILYDNDDALANQPPSRVPYVPGWSSPSAGPLDLGPLMNFTRQILRHPPPASPDGPATDMLLQMERYRPALNELARAVAERPLVRFPAGWEGKNLFDLRENHGYLLHINLINLRFRTAAEMGLGRAAEALEDTLLALRLCRALDADPVGFQLYQRPRCTHSALNSVWQGLNERRWSTDELARLQAELERDDLLAGYLRAVRGERARLLAAVDYAVEQRPEWPPYARKPPLRQFSHNRDAYIRYAPPGWIDQSKALFSLLLQRHFIDPVDPTARRVHPEACDSLRTSVEQFPAPYLFLVDQLLGTINDGCLKMTRYQTAIDHAAVSCALERFHLAHQSYPDTLSKLVPEYLGKLPHDLVSGEPLHYEQTPAGRYRIYSVGWNGRDDGGKVVWRSKTSLDDREGDWAWQYEPLW